MNELYINKYPLISEYVEAIKHAENNLNQLSYLRPVLDDGNHPVMKRGDSSAVFKMMDQRDGKLYALKCFTNDQKGRSEAYRLIADELKDASSTYLVSVNYINEELYVVSDQSTNKKYSVLLMDWVDGETLDVYINQVRDEKETLQHLFSNFCQMASWLLQQPFAHGNLNPENILVRADGSLVLVDYDGMYVPAMSGQLAREIGSPNFRLPTSTVPFFNNNIDDFPIALISLVLRAIILQPALLDEFNASGALLFVEDDFRSITGCMLYQKLLSMISDSCLSKLLLTFNLALTGSPISMAYLKVLDEISQNKQSNTHSKLSIVDEEIKGLIDAAENDDFDAQYHLGKCYEKGDGIDKDLEAAAKWYRRAAEKGNSHAQNALGECYYYGRGVIRDEKSAVEWFQKAAEQGHLDSQFWLGFCYINGVGVDYDRDKSIMWYRKALYPTRIAAQKGDVIAQINLGYCYRYGNGVGRNMHTAINWFLRAAKQNVPEAQKALGDCYSRYEELGPDFSEAVKWYRMAAEQGYPHAQLCLGECYLNGNGVKQDCKIAVQWFQKAANQGLTVACLNLGLCLKNGIGVKKNMREGLDWIQKAAELGSSKAQICLGECYERGDGVCQDYVEAVKWYSLTAKDGHVESQNRIEIIYDKNLIKGRDINWFMREAAKGDVTAQLHLGRCYYYGTSLDCNYDEAVKWFFRASDQGYALANRYLGECYEKGFGVVRDDYESVLWYRKASNQGDTQSLLQLGKCYYFAIGVRRDYNVAFRSFNNASKQRVPSTVENAEYYLGECYLIGCGNTSDFQESIRGHYNPREIEHVKISGEKERNIDNTILDEPEPFIWSTIPAEQEDYEVNNPVSPIIENTMNNDKDLEVLETKTADENNIKGIEDGLGGVYSSDWTRLLYVQKNIQEYNVKNGTKVIGKWAFSGCEELTHVVIPNTVTTIENNSFRDCNQLEEVILPDSVIEICDFAFTGSGLVDISIPKSTSKISPFAFYGCQQLIAIHVEKGNVVFDSREDSNAIIHTASNSLVLGCCNTKIPSAVNTIAPFAFAYCNNLTDIVLPNSITDIGKAAFLDCHNLTSLDIPDSVKSIGNAGFLMCSKLKRIIIPESVTSIGNYSFAKCNDLEHVTIPNSIYHIGEKAFGGCPNLEKDCILNSAIIINVDIFAPLNIKELLTL